VLHAGQAGSFPYPDEDRLRRDRQMSETRETVEKLKHELQEVRAATVAQASAAPGQTPATDALAVEAPRAKPTAPVRARGQAARAVADGGGAGQLSLDLAGLGIKDADRTKLSTAVQTTRAILAEYA
jgi:type IV secretion system protein VirD4